ncbi:MAG: hypothetical protein LBL75_03745 [Rickettsiales bacterium]|nr:hypothetical protein [Rickettsiales bacterium]
MVPCLGQTATDIVWGKPGVKNAECMRLFANQSFGRIIKNKGLCNEKQKFNNQKCACCGDTDYIRNNGDDG